MVQLRLQDFAVLDYLLVDSSEDATRMSVKETVSGTGSSTYIHTLTYCFYTVGCLLLLYFILFRSKLEYALPAWNVTTSNGSNLECVKWKFAAPSLIHFSLISLTVMLLH